MTVQEQWKDVPGYEGRYQVSDHGNVRSMNYRGTKGRVHNLRVQRHPCGYRQVTLSDGKGNTSVHLVHSLVAAAFIGPRPDSHDINHRDNRRDNNHISNLEYCTRRENLLHARREHGRGQNKLTRERVIDIYVTYMTKKATMQEIADRQGLSIATVHSVVHRRTWSYVNVEAHLPIKQLTLPGFKEAA